MGSGGVLDSGEVAIVSRSSGMESFGDSEVPLAEEGAGLASAAVAMDVDPDGPGGLGGRGRIETGRPEDEEG